MNDDDCCEINDDEDDRDVDNDHVDEATNGVRTGGQSIYSPKVNKIRGITP